VRKRADVFPSFALSSSTASHKHADLLVAEVEKQGLRVQCIIDAHADHVSGACVLSQDWRFGCSPVLCFGDARACIKSAAPYLRDKFQAKIAIGARIVEVPVHNRAGAFLKSRAVLPPVMCRFSACSARSSISTQKSFREVCCEGCLANIPDLLRADGSQWDILYKDGQSWQLGEVQCQVGQPCLSNPAAA
jgi:hypothetical protein